MISILYCIVPGCESKFETEEAVSSKAKYICRNHTKYEQDIFFQETQFDRELNRKNRLSGTEDDNYDPGSAVNQEH